MAKSVSSSPKEFVDLFRSGSIKKMTVSYAVPLLVLLGMAWLVDFAEAPIPINLLSYAPFLGFFGFNFYSWLTILDSPEFMNGLPLTGASTDSSERSSFTSLQPHGFH
jgi:hypothetical protein